MHVCWNWENIDELGMGKFLKDGMNYYQVKQIQERVKGKRTLIHLKFYWVRCSMHNRPLVAAANVKWACWKLDDGWLMVHLFTSLLTAYWSDRDRGSRGTMSRKSGETCLRCRRDSNSSPCCWSVDHALPLSYWGPLCWRLKCIAGSLTLRNVRLFC